VAAFAPMPAPVAPAPVQKKGGALKVVLIVVGILVILAILVAGAIGYGIYKAKKALEAAASSVNSVQMTSPDTVPAANPPSAVSVPATNPTTPDQQAAVNQAAAFGVELYPGVTPSPGASGAMFQTRDLINKVAQFYVDKYPNATYTATEAIKATLVVNTATGPVTIVVAALNGDTDAGTTITLSR
jgi:hypothetical protein